MSYTPTTWAAGDTVTAAKSNKLEQGVASGGGVLVVGVNGETGTLDKTWKEIHDAPMVILKLVSDETICAYFVNAYSNNGSYYVIFALPAIGQKISFDNVTYVAESVNDYPVFQRE